MKTIFRKFSGTQICAGLIVLFSAVAAQSGTVVFNYDLAGRMTKAEFTPAKSINYTYDSAGNLLQRAINTGPVDPDSDGDGIPDWWMELHFGHSTGQAGDKSLAHYDADEDGMTNLQEFLAGTVPTDPNSALKVLGNPELAGGATIEWQAVSGKTYRLQFKNALSDAEWTNVTGDVTANSNVASKLDPTASGQPQRLYRVLLVP
jgi:YD repeat-containing protein